MTTVLAVTECYSAGTGAVMEMLARNAPDITFHLMWDGPDGELSTSPFETAVKFPAADGLMARSRAVRQAAIDHNVDLIHAHSSWAGVYARLRRMPVPVVYQPHCYAFLNPSAGRLGRLTGLATEILLSLRTARTIAVSEYEAAHAVRVSAGRVPVSLVPNASRLASLAEAPSTVLTRQYPLVVAMAGRISPQKDPHFFAAVAEEAARRGLDVRFVWIGGSEDKRLTGVLTSAGVTVTGWLGSRDLAFSLRKADIYLHSAAVEGFPMSILDAAVLRLPILARPIPALRGMPITQISTAEAMCSHIARMASSPATWAETVDQSRLLLDAMNENTQVDALMRAYSKIGKVAS